MRDLDEGGFKVGASGPFSPRPKGAESPRPKGPLRWGPPTKGTLRPRSWPKGPIKVLTQGLVQRGFQPQPSTPPKIEIINKKE